MIKQIGKFNDLVFEEGDILKITIEDEGTKNLYIGKFVSFTYRGLFKRRVRLLLRHHTLCSEGLFEIEANDITNIEKIEAKK